MPDHRIHNGSAIKGFDISEGEKKWYLYLLGALVSS